MSDTKFELICPACGEVMKKVYSKNDSVFLDICVDGCGGIWFDNQEFEKFDEQHEDIDFILSKLEDKHFKPVADAKRWCPVCAIPMVKTYASTRKEVVIDECYNCGGRFLDNDELVSIRAQFQTASQADNEARQVFENDRTIKAAFANQEMEINEIKRKKSLIGTIFNLFPF